MTKKNINNNNNNNNNGPMLPKGPYGLARDASGTNQGGLTSRAAPKKAPAASSSYFPPKPKLNSVG